MKCSAAEARTAVDCGYWPLYRYTPPSALAAAAAAAPPAAANTAAGADAVPPGAGEHPPSGAAVPAAAAAPLPVRGRLILDSKKLKGQVEGFLAKQNRFAILSRRNPAVSAELHQQLQGEFEARMSG